MDAGPRKLSALPTSLVVEAPMVAPRLIPETVNGYRLPRNSSTPSPPPTPTMKPPLVNTTATLPVSAKLGVASPADVRKPSTATSVIRVRLFVMCLPVGFLARATMARDLMCEAGLLREDHREVAEHSKQDAGDGV